MNAVYIIGCAAAGVIVGGIAGAYYGFATDKSDLPIAAAFTTPIGGLIGGAIGVVAGAIIFT